MNKYILSVNYQYFYNYQTVIGIFDKENIDAAKANWVNKNLASYGQECSVDYFTLHPVDNSGNVVGDVERHYVKMK